MRPSSRSVAALLFSSGLSALLYQTAWQRSFRLLFGASTAASAAVLAVFLGGLGAGGLLLGRTVEKSRRPLFVYGNLEMGVSVAAAASPLILSVLGRVYVALGGVERMGQGVATLVRLAITVFCIGPAVVLMGGTLPAAARAVEVDDDRGRARLAALYAANTTGAVAGALLGTFVLFELFGTRLCLWSAALLNLGVAVVGRSLGRAAEEVPVTVTARAARGEEHGAPSRSGVHFFACAVSAGVGFAFLLLEIVWYRVLAPLLGGSTYTFGLVLAVALAGIGAGGFLYALRSENRPATLSELATVTILEGVLVALPLAVGDGVAIGAAITRQFAVLGFPALVASWSSVTLFVVFGAAVASGYQFPLLFALQGQGRDRVASDVGTLYAFNTAGAIAGSLIGGLFLLQRLGAVGCWRLVAALLFVLGGVSLVLDHRRRPEALGDPTLRRSRLRALPAVALAILGVVLVTRTGPTAVWRHSSIGAGRVKVPLTANALRSWESDVRARVLWQDDGVESAVALTKMDELAFVVNGKSDGSVFHDRGMQAGSGLIAALVHPAPTRALVVGLGTGMTAGWLSVVPGIERVDVAELEPAILEVAKRSASVNHDVLSRRNVSVRINDGRELVLTTRETYDLVVSEPSNPYRAGVSSLYTEEFYRAVKERLRPGAIFVQWVQGYEIDADTIRTVARTLRSVLPHVEVWSPQHDDILFLASDEARVLDVDRMRARMNVEPLRSGLARALLIQDAEGLLGRFRASDVAVERLTATGSGLNTDDLNILEFAFARTAGTESTDVPLQLFSFGVAEHEDRPRIRGDVDWERVAELRPRAWMQNGSAVHHSTLPAAPAAAARVRAVALGCWGDRSEGMRPWLDPSSAEPRDDVERFVAGAGLALRGDQRAAAWADQLDSRGFSVEAAVLRAHSAVHDGRVADAMSLTLRAIEWLRHEMLPLCDAPQQVLELAESLAKSHSEFRRDAAVALLRGPFDTYGVDLQRIQSAQLIAFSSGDASLCVRALGEHVQAPRWEEEFLSRRLKCTAAAGHPLAQRAADDLLEFRSATGGTLR